MRAKLHGQALLMVTVALVAMFGLLGLAVDLGWEFYVHKTARAAADSAALAAVRQARASVLGTAGSYSCQTNGFTCTPPIPCSGAPGNLAVGCQFAITNGFPDGGLGGRQTVRIESNVGDGAGCATCVPTAPGVVALYWVHVTATETVPQIFSGILGNTTGTVSADATAALLSVVVPGSIILLNREYDKSDAGTGIDFHGGGSEQIKAPGGILLAANSGTVGRINGSASVDAPFTYIRGSGTADWAPYTNGFPDLAFFQDPESGKGQPPLDFSQKYIPVRDGKLSNAIADDYCTGNVCPPGNYYATTVENRVTKASGDPIYVDADVQFKGGTFGNFAFFGGLQFQKVNSTLGPGRYILVGTRSGKPLMDIGNGAIYGGDGNDAGRIFILTDSSYGGDSGLASVIAGIPEPKAATWSLGFGDVFLQSGNGVFSLYGLNKDGSGVPGDLQNFRSVVMWQDQRNSTVLYDTNGYVRNSPACGGDGADRACPNLPSASQVVIKGGTKSATTTIAGIVYQPRGASTSIDANTNFNGSLALVTGALDMKGSATLNLSGEGLPITTLTSALVH